MRLRTHEIPYRPGVSNGYLDGAQLGAVLANAVGLPFVFGMYWAMGWTGWGVLFFGAWVFVMTLWARMYHFAVRINYVEADDD